MGTILKTRGDSSIRGFGLSLDANPRYRKSMEDEHVIIEKLSANKNLGYFAIYDGHGGTTAAKYLKDQLHENIMKALKATDPMTANVPEIFRKSFIQTDEELIKKGEKSGSTAAVALIRHGDDGSTLYTANIGDARIVLNRNGIAVAVTKDHKASDPGEIDRIKKMGGLMIQGKVAGSLAVTRAFGDSELKPWVSVDPYIEETKLKPTDNILILACDGLWDVCSNQEAVDLIINEKDPQVMSDNLLKYALEHGTKDNVSIIVLSL